MTDVREASKEAFARRYLGRKRNRVEREGTMIHSIRKFGFIGMAMLMSMLVLAVACSSGDDDSSSSAASSSTTAAPTAAAQAAPAATTPAVMAPEADQPIYGGTLRFAQQRDNRVSWDPHATRGGQSLAQNTGSWWHNGLMSRANGVNAEGGDTNSYPDLAESWEISNGGLTYTFHLIQGVKFHDKAPVNGREMTSEDVKWSYERFLKGPDSDKWQLSDISSIETPDKYTVVMHLKDSVASFLTHVGEPLAFILPKEAATMPPKTPSLTLAEEFLTPDGIIGTGPYVFETWEKDKLTAANRNPNYFKQDELGNQLPFIERLEYVVIPDAAARMAAFTSGDIAALNPPSGSTKEFMSQNPNANFVQDLPSTVPGYNFRLYRDIFDDIRLRRAVTMAIDQQAFIDLRLGSKSARTWGQLPKLAFPEYDVTPEFLGAAAKWWQYDPQASRDLLAEAGYGPNNPLKFVFQASSCCLTDYYPELTASMLAEVGIEMEIRVVDHSVHLKTSNVGVGDYDMAHSRVKGAEVEDLLLTFTTGNAKNGSHVDDPALNAMIAAQRVITDPAQRFAAIRGIQKYLADQVYLFYIPDRQGEYFWQPEIKGFRPHAGNTEGRDWERAWIDPS
jgi:peptide/nickel transport system substrate-binding protein